VEPPSPPSADSLLTVDEIAGILKLNPQTVRNWIDRGYLGAIRIGRRVRVPRAEFDRLIEESYTGGTKDGQNPRASRATRPRGSGRVSLTRTAAPVSTRLGSGSSPSPDPARKTARRHPPHRFGSSVLRAVV
jgi:excisionase family DNA binding protein